MPQTIQRSFTSGEIAPAVRSRADLVRYATGLARCENFFIRSQGGAYSRSGLRFIGETANASQQARLIPFSFNVEQAYVLVMEENSIQVVRNGGYVINGDGSIYTIPTPYTEAQLLDIRFTQSADILTFTHPAHVPANLGRIADDDWTLADINFTPTINAPAIPTLATVGSGAGTFTKTYVYVVTAVNADGTESIASPSASITTGSLATTAGVRVSWAAVTDAVRYRVYKDPSVNSGVYGWIGNSNTNQFTDFNIAPLTSDAPPEDRNPFDSVDNYPSAVTYYQQRQVFANTQNEPQTVFTTQTNDFQSLRTSNPSRDDDAITFTINAREVNEIRHMIPLDSLVILTSGGEWVLSEGRDEVLTPATVGVRIQSYNGCSRVPPVVINSTALYMQEKGARLRDLGYEFANDQYTGTDLSLTSEHLFEGFEITSMAYSAEPYSILWCVRNDGVLLGLTYQREHQVVGWHQHTTDGEFESVTVISEDDRDAVYVTVKRTITDVNGVTTDRRYVERMEFRESKNVKDCFYVDSGLTLDNPSTGVAQFNITATGEVFVTDINHGFDDDDTVCLSKLSDELSEFEGGIYTINLIDVDGYQLTTRNTRGTQVTNTDNPRVVTTTGESRSSVTSISGLSHLEGKTLVALADGNEVTGLTVTSGTITLPYESFIVHAGLPYTPIMETLDVDTSVTTETLKANVVSVGHVVVETQESRGLWIGPLNEDGTATNMVESKSRSESDNYNAIELSSSKEKTQLQPIQGRSGAVRIEQRSPLPLTVLSVIPQLDIGGN